MFFLYILNLVGIFVCTYYTITNVASYIMNLFYVPNIKFEDLETKSDYYLLNYKIWYESGKVFELEYLDETVLEEIEEDIKDEDAIKYITIDYLFNDGLMKYITYNKDISFPIYDITFKCGGKKLMQAFVDSEDVTGIIKSFMGPKNNFYKDKMPSINLVDIFHVSGRDDLVSEEKINNSVLKLIDDSGNIIENDLKWNPCWKKYSGNLDNSHSERLTSDINNTNSIFNYTII